MVNHRYRTSIGLKSGPFPRRFSLRRRLPAIAGILAVVVAVMFITAYLKGWKKMVRLDCQSNLRQMGLLCREYAAEHVGHFPSTWGELNRGGDDTNWVRLLRCPSTHHEVGVLKEVDLSADYRLLPGRTTNDPPDTILAQEPLENHGSVGANVLFVDGGTQWWPASRFSGL